LQDCPGEINIREIIDKAFGEIFLEKTYLIAPPTSCPKFRDTIHKAKYFPRAPEGASVMIAPASATYQHAVPIPLIAPLRIRY
jgi:hypothetical protein